MEDINEINSLVKRTNVATIFQANPLTGKESDCKKKNVKDKLLLILKKWKLKQLERGSVIDYSFNNFVKDSSWRNKGGKGGSL